MSEDPPSRPPHRTWFARLTQALSGEPQSREELIEELRHAQANGLLSNDTLSMIEGAIEVAELTVADVMVPRAQIVFLPIDAPQRDILGIVIESGHSRFPVHDGDKDEILGILLAKDLLRCLAEGAPCDIRALLRPVAMIPESKRLNILLKEFRLSRNHMAIVVDEYGGVAGLVTIEDVLEQIVGDIDDEHDIDEADSKLIQPQSDGALPGQRADADRRLQRALRQRIQRRRVRHRRRHGHQRDGPPAGTRRGSRARQLPFPGDQGRCAARAPVCGARGRELRVR